MSPVGKYLGIFEPGDTRQFTLVTSVSVDSGPWLNIWPQSLAAISSQLAVQSDTTHFYAYFTMPTSEGWYSGQWTAYKTLAGSLRFFNSGIDFEVRSMRAPT